jgi:hypothetical protein
MGVFSGPANAWSGFTDQNRIDASTKVTIQDGLILNLDAGASTSYSGSGSTWTDLSGNGNDFTIDASGFTHNSSGYFSMADGGISRSGALTSSSTCTCVFWMRTADVQSLFFSKSTGSFGFLGAYRSANKYYNSEVGSPTIFMDRVSISNLYDNIIDDQWHMIEFKSVDFSTWSAFNFNKYSTFTFGDGAIASISIYDRNLTERESQQNFNALRGRFGI